MTDLDLLPFGSDYNPPERIVCAANQYGEIVIAGVRHSCNAMCDSLEAMMNHTETRKLLDQWLHTYGQEGYEVKTDLTDDLSLAMKYELRDFIRKKEVQGFLTSKHRFVTREEAWIIAREQNQIVRRCGGDMYKGVGRLFSENLY